jgi:hypothetical protein
MTVEFRGDGYFGATLKGETRGGSYMFSEADGKLITKRDSGDEETLQVSWKGDNLVLADEKLKVTLRRL